MQLRVIHFLGASALTLAGCSGGAGEATEAPRDNTRLSSSYDSSGKLEKLEYDRNNDGKPDMWGYMDGTRVVRVEVDENGDGIVDRWEFHRTDGPASGTPGIAQPGDRTLEHVERATKFDGKVSRWEYFTDGVLTRIEEDTDGDGKVDKWESYRAGTLETLSLDTQGRGKPDRRLVYAPDGSFVRMESDVKGTGSFEPVNP